MKERPRIVCLCGSGRFKDAFDKAEFDLTLQGEIVLTIGCNTHDIVRDIKWHEYKLMLDELHKHKIDICDYVFVVNVAGYIGESTRGEIEYAYEQNKPVKFLERFSNQEFLKLSVETRRKILTISAEKVAQDNAEHDRGMM